MDDGTDKEVLDGADATAETGLTAAQVTERVARGLTNEVLERTSRSYWDIIRANTFTRFNAILGVLFIIIALFGQLRDGLFGMVLVANTLVGIVQEVRAKRTLDRLSLLSAPRARVVRDSSVVEVLLGEVVLDDVVELRRGDQVVADGEVLTSVGLDLDESLITGESVPVEKRPGDKVLSGSFAVSGSGRYRATAVGDESYARRLTVAAKKFGLVPSELRDGINKILRYITWIMVPAGLLLFFSQLLRVGDPFSVAVTGTVAGLVGMVPEGLVLLTSVAFAVSVVILGRSNVLVQELPAVEGLARVDVICLDKTGTLTEGDLVFSRLEELGGSDDRTVREALGALASNPAERNTTLAAISEAFPAPTGWDRTGYVPFSSATKWSSATFEGKGTWLLGAPEVLMDGTGTKGDGSLFERVDELARSGLRVLLLATSDVEPAAGSFREALEPAALLTLEEKIRPDAGEALSYFTEQEVKIKVISGDNPTTVASVARRAGVPDVGEPVDARGLPEDKEELAEAMERGTVFGRVTPDQKESMVEALQSKGHVVAMTGDGVNDVLALKKSDIGIAMGSGSSATKSVAQIVLLDGRFSTMPGVVAEGRRVIGNIERVANLFLTKTVYATLLTIVIGLIGWTFIFMPRHLTLVSSLTIGGPALVLSFAPNTQRYRPGFVGRVMRFTIPAGIVAGTGALAAGAFSHIWRSVNLAESRTMATLVLVCVGLWVLVVLSRPFNWWKAALVGTMALAFVLVMAVPYARDFFALDLPGWTLLLQTGGIIVACIIILEVIWAIVGWSERVLPRVLERFKRPEALPPP